MDRPDYIAGALADRHKPRTIGGRILAAVGDVYGGQHAQAVAERIDTYLDNPTLRRVTKEETCPLVIKQAIALKKR